MEEPEKAKDPFAHKIIEVGFIRLLKIESVLEEASSSLIVRLSIHSFHLPAAPSYEALSYEWGDPSKVHEILIDDRRYEIRENLWWCLRYLHRHGKSGYLWIDALCIDQDNIPERNAQVQRMGEIYSTASRVLIWLGLANGADSVKEDLCVSPDTFKRMDRKGFRIFCSMYHRSYWSRMWIVQECMLASKITLICGRHQLSPDQTPLPIRLLFMKGNDRELRKHFPSISSPRLVPLSAMLHNFKDKQCTDPRDRIFSLLNTIVTVDRLALSHVFPNYFLTTQQVQVLTMAYMLMTSGGNISPRTVGGTIMDATHYVPPESLGLESREAWNQIFEEAMARCSFRPAPIPHTWTWTLLCRADVWKRPSRAILAHEEKIKQLKTQWADDVGKALVAILEDWDTVIVETPVRVLRPWTAFEISTKGLFTDTSQYQRLYSKKLRP